LDDEFERHPEPRMHIWGFLDFFDWFHEFSGPITLELPISPMEPLVRQWMADAAVNFVQRSITMARKAETPKKIETVKKSAKGTVSTPVRNSAIPKLTPVVSRKPLEITTEVIARKAFEIFASGQGGSELDNWFAAERELRQAA
jgi:hypothetical protein